MGKYESYPLGVDVSFYQGEINWDRLASVARFSFIRAGQNNFIDSKYTINWTNSKGKHPRDAYWFFDWRDTAQPAETQGKLFRDTMHSPGEIRPVMDFENPYAGWSTTPFPNRATSLNLMDRFHDAVGVAKMLLYCNMSTLKGWQPLLSWVFDKFDLWIAAYPYASGTSNQCTAVSQIPDTFSPNTYGWRWTFWQFTSKLSGLYYGVSSASVDGNLFNGTQDELNAYTKVGLTDAEKLRRLWEAHPELWDA